MLAKDYKGMYLSMGDTVTCVYKGKLYSGKITRIRLEIDGKVLRSAHTLIWEGGADAYENVPDARKLPKVRS